MILVPEMQFLIAVGAVATVMAYITFMFAEVIVSFIIRD